jgi:hypothetical protein
VFVQATGYPDCLAHPGLTNMAERSGLRYNVLGWTAEWYVREETLRAANPVIIALPERLPLASAFGTGTFRRRTGSGSHGRRPTTTHVADQRFADEGLSIHTPTSPPDVVSWSEPTAGPSKSVISGLVAETTRGFDPVAWGTACPAAC